MTSHGPDDGLRALLRAHVPSAAWTAIETGGTGLGIADCNYLFRGGVEGWIECKATDGWAVTFRPEQIGWLSRRVRYGGRAWVAVRRRHGGGPRRGPAVDELWLVPACNVAALARDGLQCVPTAAAWHGGPARWDWAAFAQAIAR